MNASTLVRIVLLAVLVVGAAGWALVHHYAWRSPPMLVPAPPTARPAPTYDADAGETPVPEDFEIPPAAPERGREGRGD